MYEVEMVRKSQIEGEKEVTLEEGWLLSSAKATSWSLSCFVRSVTYGVEVELLEEGEIDAI